VRARLLLDFLYGFHRVVDAVPYENARIDEQIALPLLFSRL
jgi:hypothetical protein